MCFKGGYDNSKLYSKHQFSNGIMMVQVFSVLCTDGYE